MTQPTREATQSLAPWMFWLGGGILMAGLMGAIFLTRCQPAPSPTGDAAPLERRSPPPQERRVAKGPMKCNGHELLCAKSYDQVSYLTTHNAMSSIQDGWKFPNQNHAILKQLEDGVRGLMLDVHDDKGTPMLCHAKCSLGSELLVKTLEQIRLWLQANPHDVLTLIFESYVSAKAMKSAFEQGQLLPKLYAHPNNAPWPTLQQMITRDQRLVVFTDKEGGVFPWYHKVWDHAWETHFSAKTAQDFSCKKNRGQMGNPLFIFNHFLTNPFAAPKYAREVNKNPLLMDRAQKCKAESGKLPNFVTVDFYDIGDAKKVVAQLNELPH